MAKDKDTERSANSGAESVIAVVEGRLVEKGKGSIKVEVFPGLTLELRGDSVNRVRTVQDDDSARPFVEFEITLDDLCILEVQPQLLSDAVKGGPLPFVFALQQGMAFAKGTQEPAIAGSEEVGCGDEFFFPLNFGVSAQQDTSSAYRSCRSYTRSLWGTSCDKYVGDLMRDDPPRFKC